MRHAPVAWPSGDLSNRPCACGNSKVGICNLTDCTQQWAVDYGRSVRIRWYERIVGTVVAFVAWWR